MNDSEYRQWIVGVGNVGLVRFVSSVIDRLIQANGESAHIDLHKAKGRMRLNLRH